MPQKVYPLETPRIRIGALLVHTQTAVLAPKT